MRILAVAACAVLALVVPPSASAAIDVREFFGDELYITASGDGVDVVTIDRNEAGDLRIREATSTVTSSDGICSSDPQDPAVATCSVPAGTVVTVTLGAGNDSLDARAATGVRLVVDAGRGSDTIRLGASGMARVVEIAPNATIDLSHADAPLRVRYEGARRLLVARCGGCSTPWAVMLPFGPGRVWLGAHADDVDLGAWPAVRRTTWLLGAGHDRFFGSATRRSIVDGGAGDDQLVSRAAADVLRGGHGADALADLGGAGDVLLGGPGVDALGALDRRRDTLDGGAGRDMCLATRRSTASCGEGGTVRNIDTHVYFPFVTRAGVLAALGIR